MPVFICHCGHQFVLQAYFLSSLQRYLLDSSNRAIFVFAVCRIVFVTWCLGARWLVLAKSVGKRPNFISTSAAKGIRHSHAGKINYNAHIGLHVG